MKRDAPPAQAADPSASKTLDWWTHFITQDVVLGSTQAVRSHPLDLSAQHSLVHLPSGSGSALGIVSIGITIEDKYAIISENKRDFLKTAPNDQNITHQISRDASALPFGSIAQFVSKPKDMKFTLSFTVSRSSHNHISESMITTFAESMFRKIIANAVMSHMRLIDRGHNRFDASIRRARAKGALPGTILANTIGLVSIYSSCITTLVCTHDNGKHVLEYIHINRGKLSQKKAKHFDQLKINIRVPSLVTDRLKQKRPYHAQPDAMTDQPWSTLLDDIQRVPALATSGVAQGKRISLSFTPIIWGTVLLGSIIQVFHMDDKYFIEGTTPLAARAASDYADIFRWIWQRRWSKLITDPIFHSRESRTKEKTVFIIMPFSEPWSKGVESTVRDVMSSMGFSVDRADDMFGKNIMEDIWTGILRSQYVICDTTGRNPNVYYELGICHTLGKSVILLTQNASDIPFDIRHLRHIVYQNTLDGAKNLKDSIRKLVESDAANNRSD